MALQSSGSISLSDIATEFGGTPPHSMSEYFGQGNAPGSGNAIGLGLHFYGTSNRVVINLTISANTNNYNIWNSKGGSYSAGNTDVILTINSGVAVGSAGINSYALDTGTGWNANDTITIINNGTIIGKGGNGGKGGNLTVTTSSKSDTYTFNTGAAGERGGHGLRLQFATSIQNNYRIQAGGGGGGGSGAYSYLAGMQTYHSAGNGGGGGAGRNVGSGGAGGTWGGGTAYGSAGSPGNNGSLTGGGGVPSRPASGGNGGGPGAAGANGQAGNASSSAGGGRGNYITGNSYATWTATGTRSGLAA